MSWYEKLLQKKRELEEYLLIRQRETLFRWIQQKEKTFAGKVLVALPDEISFFALSEGRWRKIKSEPSELSLRFILCSNKLFGKLSSEFHLNPEEWVNIFSAPTFEVWERAVYYEEQGKLLPLRLSLSENEKSWITKEVRRMIEVALHGEEPLLAPDPSHRLQEQQDLDIAIWVDGRIRASVIMLDQPCREALQTGSKRATWDKRFPPLKLEEVERMRIEITFMSDLVFPVLESDLGKDRIDPTKGYVATFAQYRGWFLPEVHNVVSFHSLRTFLTQLATKKAKIAPERVSEAKYGQFSVMDWVENGAVLMSLAGPTEVPMKRDLFGEDGKRVLKEAVAWLSHVLETSGNFHAIYNEKGIGEQEGWPALGCTGHALACYGKTYDDKQAMRVAETIWQRLYGHIAQEKNEDLDYFFTVVYFLRLSLLLNKSRDAALVIKLIENLKHSHAVPVLWLQTLSFLVEYEQSGFQEYATLLRSEAKEAEKAFERHQTLAKEQIAFYPELIAVFHGLWTVTKEAYWYNQALKHIAWYKKMQQANGSFPYSLSDMFAYTRGTGKVFEVLACFPEETKETLEKSFAWLQTMQYSKANTFFLNETEQDRLVGGFRHDAFHREAWIDASAHVILGLSRLKVGLKFQV